MMNDTLFHISFFDKTIARNYYILLALQKKQHIELRVSINLINGFGFYTTFGFDRESRYVQKNIHQWCGGGVCDSTLKDNLLYSCVIRAPFITHVKGYNPIKELQKSALRVRPLIYDALQQHVDTCQKIQETYRSRYAIKKSCAL